MLTRRSRAHLSCVVLLLAVACGDATPAAPAPSRPVAVDQPLVAPGHVVVLRGDGSLASITPDGDVAAVLGSVPADAGEPDAVAASADGRLVLVSAVRFDDDAPATCAAQVLQVLPDGQVRRLTDGSSLSLSADGRRLAFFRNAEDDGFCRRTALVVRDLAAGSEVVVTASPGAVAGRTPPDWPVSLSPDAARVAHVAADGAVVTTLATGETRAVAGGRAGRPLSPAWLADGRLAALHGCCIGPGAVRVEGSSQDLFAVPGPLRSLRAGRDGAGVWFTVEEQGLHHWDGTTTRRVHEDALLTSG